MLALSFASPRYLSKGWLLIMASLVEFKPHARESDAVSDAGSDKEPAGVTTALIGSSGRALGAPEVRRTLWWSRVKASDPDAIATQVTLLPVDTRDWTLS
jgi:hypothetical protein